MSNKRRGLVIVFTGDGKGKTTVALGIALRAIGRGRKVLMIQFIKGTMNSGEIDAAQCLVPHLEIVQVGKGFVGIMGDKLPRQAHVQAARDGLTLVREKARSDQYDILILDEINNAMHLGLLSVDEVLAFIREKPARLHLVLTGRDAPPQIIEAADLVTEMRNIKHPYDAGLTAYLGLEL